MNNPKPNSVICPSCKRNIVPRISFWDGEPRSSWCPFCGGKVQDFYTDSGILGFLFLLAMVVLLIYASQ